MTILTPALIEKAASAMYHAYCAETGSFGFDEPPTEWVATARAALQAVIPDVVEKCAKAAEGELLSGSTQYRGDGASDWSITSFYGKGRTDSAASVRRLIPQEGK